MNNLKQLVYKKIISLPDLGQRGQNMAKNRELLVQNNGFADLTTFLKSFCIGNCFIEFPIKF